MPNKNIYYIEKVIKMYFNGKLRAKYNIEKKRSEQDYNPQGVRFSESSKTNYISHEIENFMSVKTESEQRTSFLKLLIDEIEVALNTLIVKNVLEDGTVEFCKDDYNLLKWSYQRIPNYSDAEVAAKFNIARSTVSYRRNKLFVYLYDLINIDFYINNPIKDIASFFDDLIDG
ncbi:MAG: hypothetical protein MI740_10420 [Halanaerobiales bacterium]|nr:hypothetical protein [Halanaerobiales bacterium]